MKILKEALAVKRKFNPNRQTILFINPPLNQTGLYKYILPSIILPEVAEVNTIVTNISEPDADSDIELDSKMLLRTDMIVFPFTPFSDLTQAYEQIRRINPKIKIIYNVDFNFYELPVNHQHHQVFEPKAMQELIESNIINSDHTFVTNKLLLDILFDRLSVRSEEENADYRCNINMFPQLTDFSILLSEKLPEGQKPPNSKFRLGIIADENDYDSISTFKAELSALDKNDIQIYSIGFSGVNKRTMKNAYDDIPIEVIKPTPMMDFYKRLNSLNLDAVFIPLANTDFIKTSTDYVRWIECAMLKIPVIASSIFPYTELIRDKENGILLVTKDKLKEAIDIVKTDGRKIGENAFQFANQYLSFHTNINSNIYLNILFQKQSAKV